MDANCKITGNEIEPDISALYKAVKHLLKANITIPWFVYTAKSMDWSDNLRNLINDDNRTWDDRDFYHKPSQRYVLFANIKKATAQKEAIEIRQKYAEICKFHNDADFLNLLIGYEKGGIETDSDIPNRVREVLDTVMERLNNMGALPVLFNSTNLNECSVCLGMMKKFVPTHVQESFRLCVNIANEGSHKESRKLIRENKAPYLNQVLIACLINILQWCSSLSGDKKQLKKISLECYTSNKNVLRYGKVTKNEAGMPQLNGVLIINEKNIKEDDIVACVKYNNNQNRYIKLAYLAE